MRLLSFAGLSLGAWNNWRAWRAKKRSKRDADAATKSPPASEHEG
jgi:threonine/homoserine/homoserine lactone efflux protein